MITIQCQKLTFINRSLHMHLLTKVTDGIQVTINRTKIKKLCLERAVEYPTLISKKKKKRYE